MTAMVLAGFVWLVAPWLDLEISFALALLLAATMSSTDSASVFSILRSKKQGLKQHLRPLLELESGSNDPMAYMLTILLIGVVTNSQGGGGLGMSALYFVVQLVVGTLSGYLIGRLAVWTINKINLANHSLYSVLLLAFIFFAFAFTDLHRAQDPNKFFGRALFHNARALQQVDERCRGAVENGHFFSRDVDVEIVQPQPGAG